MDRVVIDPEIMGGAPCVAGTRIPVITILGELAAGLSTAEVIGYHPQLVVADILSCLQYAVEVIAGGRNLP